MGLFLSKLCKDETKAWRSRLFVISILSMIVIVLVSFVPLQIYAYKIPTIISLFFIIIVCLTINWKSN